MRRRIGVLAAGLVIGVVVSGCGDSSAPAVSGTSGVSSPTSPASPDTTVVQEDLWPGFQAVQDPLSVFRQGLFNILTQPMANSVAITGYRHQIADDGTTMKAAVYAFIPATNAYTAMSNAELVWSPSKATWIDSDLTETLSKGPDGSRGWPTVKSQADFGTSYYTLSQQDLSGKPLLDGLEAGVAQGGTPPPSVQHGTFSPGAQAFIESTTTVDPTFTIHRVRDANTNVDQLQLVYACTPPTPRCQTPASSLLVASKLGGQLTNFAGSTVLEFNPDGTAVLHAVDSNIAYATLSYQMIRTDGPARITLHANTADDANKFRQAMGITVENFAIFEYQGQVAIGFAQPANTTSSQFAGYNRTAINDLLTQWTPALPPVQ